jgi:Zn-finger nucleic acid-binding protein
VLAPVSNCPRCGEPLRDVPVEKLSVSACAKCHGAKLTPQLLNRVLEAMSAELLKSFDPDMKIDKLNDASARLPCPSCARAMDTADYCGANTVHFDRCERCGVMWINSDELGAMTLMWARMEARQSRAHRQTEELIEGMTSLTRSKRIARVVSNVLFRGL